MGFFDSVSNFFSSAENKAENAVTSIYHDLKDGTVRVYDDLSHDTTKIVDTASDAVHAYTNTVGKIATGTVKDVKIALNDTKDTITHVGDNAERATGSVSKAVSTSVGSVSSGVSSSVGSVAKALPETADSLKWPLMIGGAAALIFLLKK